MQVTAVGRLGPTADSDLTIDFGSETMALFLHDVHMLEISPEQNPAQNPQPLLYQTAKQQEEQLKYSLASNLVLQCTYEQSNQSFKVQLQLPQEPISCGSHISTALSAMRSTLSTM